MCFCSAGTATAPLKSVVTLADRDVMLGFSCGGLPRKELMFSLSGTNTALSMIKQPPTSPDPCENAACDATDLFEPGGVRN